MADGVAVVTGMNIDAGAMTIDAGGALDIGRQQLTFNLYPQFTDKKSGLNGYGLPLKLSGSWSGISFTPDWGWLADKATASARNKVESEIQDELKGLGDSIRDRLGLGKSKPATPAATPARRLPRPIRLQRPRHRPKHPPRRGPGRYNPAPRREAPVRRGSAQGRSPEGPRQALRQLASLPERLFSSDFRRRERFRVATETSACPDAAAELILL